MNIVKQHAVLHQIKQGVYYADEKGNVYNSKGKKIIGNTLPTGYRQLSISLGFQNSIQVYEHIFIFLFFYGAYNPKYQIDHINKVKYDNSIDNLRALTGEENLKERNVSTAPKTKKGQFKKRGFRLIPDHMKKEIQYLYKSTFITKGQLSEKYKISRQSIYKIVEGIEKKY